MAKIKNSRFSKPQLAIFILVFTAIGYLIFRALAAPNPNLPGDLNNDNVVNITDLSVLLSNYGTSNSTADINSDGTVNILDLSTLLSHYGQSVVGTSSTIPNNLGVMGQAAPSWTDSTKWRSDSASLTSQLITANTNNSELTLSYGVAVYFAKSTDTLATVTNTNGWGTAPSGATFRLPAGAKPASGGDAHMAVVQPDGTMVEMWQASGSGSTWKAGAVSIAQPGQYTYPIAGCRGSSLTLPSGIVTPEEVKAGAINHVIAVTLPPAATSKSYVYPSTASDGLLTVGIPEGARLVLDPSYDISGLTGLSKIFAQALKTYGMMVVDKGGSDIGVLGEASESWTSIGQSNPWSAQGISDGVSLPTHTLLSHMKIAVSN